MSDPSRRRAATISAAARDTSGFGEERGDVLLATFDVPFDSAAAVFATHAAADGSRRLVIANIVEVAPLAFERVSRFPSDFMLGHDVTTYSPGLAASVAGILDEARALGIRTEQVQSHCFRRVACLIDLAREREIGMLVLGPDRRKVGRRVCRKAAVQMREQLTCLVWVSWDI
jgi:nucleotide-binding universal stress UspA family protein